VLYQLYFYSYLMYGSEMPRYCSNRVLKKRTSVGQPEIMILHRGKI
jgi:hypothetical protein